MYSKYDVYAEYGSKYCYKDSNVLRNKLGIHNYDNLKQAETDITAIKQNFLLVHPISGRFTSNHLSRIHKYLFEDVYRFAGHFREENIKKGETTFLNFKDIPIKLQALLTQLKNEHYLQYLDEDAFISRLTYYFAELNYIHPFREGNGRATREFIRRLVNINKYDIDWSKVEAITLLEAMIISVYDTSDLIRVLKICIAKENNTH